MPKRVFVLQPRPHPARRNAAEFILNAAPDGFAVTVAEPTRTLEQNARMWALLTDISEQVEWYGKRLTPEDWKHVFTASLRKLTVVPNLDGTGFVALGLSTSRMSKRELGDLMTLIEAFGAERGVEWSEPAMEAA
jgi:sulfite reductase beta subunit-like hemoprotein